MKVINFDTFVAIRHVFLALLLPRRTQKICSARSPQRAFSQHRCFDSADETVVETRGRGMRLQSMGFPEFSGFKVPKEKNKCLPFRKKGAKVANESLGWGSLLKMFWRLLLLFGGTVDPIYRLFFLGWENETFFFEQSLRWM